MLASEHLSMIREMNKRIYKLEQALMMKEAVIQSQGKTILKMRKRNERLDVRLKELRNDVARANVYVAVGDTLRDIENGL